MATTVSNETDKHWELLGFGYMRENYVYDEQLMPNDIICLIVEFTKIVIESAILSKEEQRYLLELVQQQPQTQRFQYAEWKLLCRGSTHGMNQKTFHDRCDGKKHTICLLDMHTHGYVSGGYASTEWKSTNSNTRGKDDDAYLFCVRPLDRQRVYHRSKDEAGKLKDAACGILYNKGDGFNFGYNTFFWGNYDQEPKTVYVSSRPRDYFELDSIGLLTGSTSRYGGVEFKDFEVFQLVE